MDKIRARENQQSQERKQAMQNIHDEHECRRSEDAHRTKEISNAIDRRIAIARANERNAADDFINKHRRFLDKGREAVKRKRNKTYFR